MGKPGKRKGKMIGESFVPVLRHMIESEAFKKLTNASRVAYLLLKSQIKNGDQKEIIFPYAHAQPYMNRNTFGRAIKQLIEFGFIEKMQYGGLYRRTNVYRLSEKWRKIV